MKKVIRLTESDITRIVKKVISEQTLPEYDPIKPTQGKLVQGDKNGKGVLKWKNAKYSGDLKNSLMDGYGVLTMGENPWGVGYRHTYSHFSNNTSFKGQFKNNKVNGYCEIKDQYYTFKGYFKDNLMSGYGILTGDGPAGSGGYLKGTYKGQWKDNLMSGYGEYTNSKGIKFCGNWNYDSLKNLDISNFIESDGTEDGVKDFVCDKIKTQPKDDVKQKSKTIKLPKLSPNQICTLEGDKTWSYTKTIDNKWYASKDKVNWYDISSNKKATSILNADGACKSISKISINPVELSTDSKETFIPTDDIEIGNERIPNWIVPFYN